MTDNQIQRKLNQLARISQELCEEARERYGPSGNLFFEAEGGFHLMSGDADKSAAVRQSYVKFSSTEWTSMGCGAW